MSLPTRVIEKDRELSKSADELMKLRWHWTLDPSNAKAVGFREYARSVGRDEATIRRDANAWAKYLLAAADGRTANPGAPQTPDDFKELEKMGEERQKAAQALARTTGKPVGNVAKHHRKDVAHIVEVARDRAARRGTSVEHEIEKTADWKAKANKTAQRAREERKERRTATYLLVDGKIGYARRDIRQAFDLAEGVEFDSEETDLLKIEINRLRALLNLLELRITGETPDIDWDAEFQKISE